MDDPQNKLQRKTLWKENDQAVKKITTKSNKFRVVSFCESILYYTRQIDNVHKRTFSDKKVEENG